MSIPPEAAVAKAAFLNADCANQPEKTGSNQNKNIHYPKTFLIRSNPLDPRSKYLFNHPRPRVVPT
jgi:hypothetical protein